MEALRHPTPSDAARAYLAQNPVLPSAMIHYSSQGRLLVVGTPESLSAILDQLPTQVEVTAAIEGACSPELAGRVKRRGIRLRDTLLGIDIFGWLGSFKFTATADSNHADLDAGAPFCEGGFDLILDLLAPHIARRPSPPIGYLATPWADAQQREDALAQLAQWVGEFDKPNYLRFEQAACIHRIHGKETCRRCYDVCGTWAITLDDEAGIGFNPYLCQGCGDCATVCPSEAIAYNFPSTQSTVARIDGMIQTYLKHGGKVPVLLVHDNTKGQAWIEKHQDRLPINVLPYSIEGLGSTGAEIWLMALALGAAEVLILDSGAMSAKTRAMLEAQVEWGGTILKGLGFAPEVLRIVRTVEMKQAAIPVRPFKPVSPLRHWSATADKRTFLQEAVWHLARHTGSSPSAPLPAGAPFGTIEIDARACVLCMDCVRACPSEAMLEIAQTQSLAFVESRCIQCDACALICPEQAIVLLPRYIYDRGKARTARPLLGK